MGNYCESCGGCCDKPTTPDGETPSRAATILFNAALDKIAQLEKEKRELSAELERVKHERNRIGMKVRAELLNKKSK